MILRRVIDHFRKQEWTAIAIDFLIVVFGVFVGLQVNNWNEARAERAVERSYLERLLADFEANVRTLDLNIAGHQEYGRTLSDLAIALQDGGEAPSDDALQGPLCRWFAAPLPALRDETYDELVSSGALRALRDEKLGVLLAEHAAAEEKSAYVETLLPAVQRAAAPLDDYRTWTVTPGADDAAVNGVRCGFDIDGMRRDPRMSSVIAQLYRDQKNHESFRSAELDKARAVEARLRTVMGVAADESAKGANP
jgi:hypothetical protein